MIYNFAVTISFISQAVTLQPGDVIFSGTSGTPAQLNDGDTCEVEIPGIGTLANRSSCATSVQDRSGGASWRRAS